MLSLFVLPDVGFLCDKTVVFKGTMGVTSCISSFRSIFRHQNSAMSVSLLAHYSMLKKMGMGVCKKSFKDSRK